MNKMWLIFLMVVSFCSTAYSISIDSLCKDIERVFMAKTAFSASVTLTHQSFGQKEVRVINAKIYRNDASKKYLIYCVSPESERGNGYLQIGNSNWTYMRNTRTFQHVRKNESVLGTNADVEDFEQKTFTNLYKGEVDSLGNDIITEERIGSHDTYCFTTVAISNDVDYYKKKMWVRKSDHLLLKENAYSKSGKLMLVMYYMKYAELQGITIPSKMYIVNEVEKGEKTIVDYENFDTSEFDQNIFSKSYLESESK